MQVMPDTARRFGVREPERDLHDPAINIEVGAAYLSDLRTQYENNLKLMLAAYNAGEGAVQRYGNRVPPYAETQNYVKRVIRMYGALHRRTGRQAPAVVSVVAAWLFQRSITRLPLTYSRTPSSDTVWNW